MVELVPGKTVVDQQQGATAEDGRPGGGPVASGEADLAQVAGGQFGFGGELLRAFEQPSAGRSVAPDETFAFNAHPALEDRLGRFL